MLAATLVSLSAGALVAPAAGTPANHVTPSLVQLGIEPGALQPAGPVLRPPVEAPGPRPRPALLLSLLAALLLGGAYWRERDGLGRRRARSACGGGAGRLSCQLERLRILAPDSHRSLADKELAMRASLQRVLHALTGRRPPATEDTRIGAPPSMRRRRGWARSVERLLAAAGHRPDARQFRHPDWESPLMLRTQVVRACHAELAAINAALLDQRQPVSAQALRQLKPFLHDPNASPLFGEDPALARKAAERLQWSFTGRPAP